MSKTEHFNQVDRLFHPRSVAVVGESSKGMGGPGFLLAHMKQGFTGKLYAINPKGRIKNYETYPSLLDIPGPVDHVVVAVRANVVPNIVRDCVVKGVKSAVMFTSGFREWEGEAGAAREAEIVEIARKGNLRLIGPNCMGFYCPKTGLSYRADMPRGLTNGRISILSQSGGVAMTPVFMAADKGIGFAKSISYGNECDFGAVDSLLYLAEDPDTEIICAYLEGTKDGAALRSALAAAAAAKPVLVLKGGKTDSGTRAVLSHTGAMAGSMTAWEAVCRQAGAIMVGTIEEMLDTAKLLLFSPVPNGRKMALMSVSGGLGVMFTDLFSMNGFEVPKFSESVCRDLRQWVDVPGTSIKNPLDMASSFFDLGNHGPLFKRLDREEDIDIITVVMAIEYIGVAGSLAGEISNHILGVLTQAFEDVKKPIVVVFPETIRAKIRLDLERKITEAGYAVFPGVERCSRALNNVIELHRRRSVHRTGGHEK
ncbi:MAG: CoA-binding protein [Desulfobacterales bacterium]